MSEKLRSDEHLSQIGILKKLGICLAVLITAFFYFGRGFSGLSSADDEFPNRLVTPVGTEARFLHVLIPANRRDVRLCKTLMSSAILTYPVPTLISWEKRYNNSNLDAGGWHLGVIEGIHSYLKELPSSRDEDLAIIPKAYDTWFQLRPGTLIERFFEINRQGNASIRARIGEEASEKYQVSQKVVFSAQKNCPSKTNEMACYAVPESSLASRVYGYNTDTIDPNQDPAYLKFRERYLSTGLIMGEVGALRKLFARALEVMQSNHNAGTVQSTFSQIFGEQEFQREVIRDKYRSRTSISISNFMRFFGFGGPSMLDLHPTPDVMNGVEGTPFDFGIGLDYEGLLGQSMISAGKDSDFVSHNDTSQISKSKKELKITGGPNLAISGDILRTPSPFWSRFGAKDGLPQAEWEEVPLYTNLWTGNVPATIHRSEESEQAKAFWASRWTSMWYHKNARQMMNAYGMEPYHAFAVTREKGHAEVAWWPRHEQKWQIRSDIIDKEWIEWKDLCHGFEEEIFKDGAGEWKPSRMDY